MPRSPDELDSLTSTTWTTSAQTSGAETASREPLAVEEEGVLGAVDTLARDTAHEANLDLRANTDIASNNSILKDSCGTE